MEFRIAPLIIVIVNMIYLMIVNPEINSNMPLSTVANVIKILIPFVVLFAMSIGSFIRHSYYSRTFKLMYYVLQVVNILLAVYFVVVIKEQHIGS